MQQPNTTTGAYFGIGGCDIVGGPTLTFPEVSQIIPWSLSHQVQAFNPARFPRHEPDPFLSSYGDLLSMRRPSGLRFGYEGAISESLGQTVRPSGSVSSRLQGELQKLAAQEIMDAKALAASKSHSEAERRRRERINNHLAKLRSLLPNTAKTDKASLLAEVIQHVKELKRQTSLIEETNPVPTEVDELTVDSASDEDGKCVIKASICCKDRSDLLPDLITTLRDLRLKTLKAEITTLGGRVKNVLFITEDEELEFNDSFNGDDEDEEQVHQQYCVSAIQEALKAVVEKSKGDETGIGSGSVKRRRTNIY